MSKLIAILAASLLATAAFAQDAPVTAAKKYEPTAHPAIAPKAKQTATHHTAKSGKKAPAAAATAPAAVK